MKKLALTLAIILGIALGASAQNGGLFSKGPSRDMDYEYGTREGEGPMINLPGSHGSTDDADVPLGGGIALLTGLGAAYLVAKKRKNAQRGAMMVLLALLLALTTQAWAAEGITCSAGDVGKVLCTDGSIYDNVSAAEADGKTAVAMIAYLDTKNNKGLALALADEGQMNWNTAISTCSAKTPTVTGGTWKLATKDEWSNMITAAGSYTALRDGFSSVGGTNMREEIYWSSSTQDNSSYAWSYSFYSGNLIGSFIPIEHYVRACLAFDFTASGMADEWDVVYRQTQTKQSDWTALGAGSTDGRVLGASGTATYYYVSYATDNLSFTNSTVGGSGLTIQGTVYLYIRSGKTLTCTGANASGQTGGGAGIELTAGNTLYVVGSGTLNATGGNAANGGNGANGGDSFLDYDNNKLYSGTGGTGGNGGGGAGAGIGTRGGNGGTGGTGGERHTREGSGSWDPANGNNGSAGTAGTTAGAMGNLYVVTSFVHLSATGGQAGSNGSSGDSGWSALWDGANNWSAPGGGGGGAGGFGGTASNIGTGGPGGGGGGGGAGGCLDWKGSGYYYHNAVGGSGGTNANGSSAPDGQTAEVSPTALANGKCGTNGSFGSDAVSYESSAVSNGAGGAGGGSGHASSNNSAVNLVLWPTQGAGTEESPYLISSADDWNTFVTNVNNGISFSDKVIKLTNDISVTTMAGGYQDDDNYQPFSGTFDGDGHTLTINVSNQSRFAAPFKCVSGATIRNLHTTGTIDGTGNSDGKLLAGLIGVSFGNTTITGCRSSMTLTTNFGEDAAMAGLVAGTKGGSLTIEGCVFDGSMTGASNTRCAGITGYEYTATTTTISDCLFIPATLTISTADDNYTKTFSRDPDATITNCYYTHSLGAAQGTAGYFGAATVPNTFGDMVTDYGVVKAYANGLFFNGKYYYSDAGSEENPYIIDSEDALARIASIVNSGVFDFVGKHFSLICDLDLSGRNWTPIGNNVDTSFRGNFDGNNHTISNLTVNNPSGDYNGLFGYVKGVILEPGGNDPGCDYIRNFVVKNANVRGRDYTGGVAGHVLGKLIFENVILDGATVEGADYTSGFIGFAEGIQIWLAPMDAYSPLDVQNCLFINGSVTANNAAHIYSSFDHPRSSFVMFGEISTHSFFTSCYFNNVVYNGAAAQEDYYNVQAYPVIVNAPSNINCEFLFAPIYVPGQAVQDNYVSAAGIDYNGNYYIPGTTPFRLSYNDYQYRVTSVKINGVEVGTNIGEYVLNAGGSPIDSYTVTVEYEPGLTGTGTAGDPYTISNSDEWRSLASHVNNGNNFSGKYVKLTSDISVTIPVGYRVSDSDNKPFSGTFLGDNKTITATITDNDNQGTALFCYINGATIKDLKVAGTIASDERHMAGLVGFAKGTNRIENCAVTATLNVSTDYAGGIVGHGLNSATTIEGCVFAGTINAIGSNDPNVGGIWGWSDSGTPTLVNCLEAGTYNNVSKMHPMGLQKAAGTIDKCYYINPQVGSPANVCTVSGAAPGNVRTIAGYGKGNDKWAFIASPVTENLNPSTVTGLLGTEFSSGVYNYDLYRLNPLADKEWENYHQHTDGFVLANGQGYLYAKQSDVTLTFTGAYNLDNTKEVTLQQGFNLVGNPFPRAAYINRSYYTLNSDGSAVSTTPSTEYIPPCHAVVVEATNSESLTFSTKPLAQQSTGNNGGLQIALSQTVATRGGAEAKTIDNAIVSFNEGMELGKFYFGTQDANVYIPQDGKDYAIVSVAGRDGACTVSTEIPVNFKAKENGTYTLTVNPEGVEMAYLHLIDNLTGNDVDLLTQPSYTFTARNDDYESRFRLVFVANNADLGGEGNDDFAFISNGQLIVTGEGTLQVVDMMGRVISTEVVNGTSSKAINAKAGVYVLRLINGENVKTQKIVVR